MIESASLLAFVVMLFTVIVIKFVKLNKQLKQNNANDPNILQNISKAKTYYAIAGAILVGSILDALRIFIELRNNANDISISGGINDSGIGGALASGLTYPLEIFRPFILLIIVVTLLLKAGSITKRFTNPVK